MGAQRVFGLLLSIACIYSANAQSQSCPSITINDLGTTTEFSDQGLVAQAVAPPSEAGTIIPVRIRDFATVCDASGDRINTSSFVSVVVEFHCDFQSSTPSLNVCRNSSIVVTRQYQFQCIEDNGQPVWGTSVAGSNLFVQTEDPTATLATPLADQCRRCIDDQQSSRADPTAHCDPCLAQCNQGQGRCYLGPDGDVCCNFYLQGSCTTDCPSFLVADSNFHCVCPALTLTNGVVSYSMPNGVERDIGSVATHTCNSGYRLEVNNAQAVENTRTCNTSGWDGQAFTCVKIMCPDLSIENGVVTISPADQGYLSRTTYECDERFALKGDGNRVCQMDDTWNGTNPECELLCGGCNNGICDETTGKCKCEPDFVGDHCSSDCSAALEDPNCAECGFDDRGMPICTKCKEGSGYTVKDGKCEKDGETSASTSSCGTGCIIGIVLAILGAIILSIVVVLVVYAVYRYLSNPATKLAKAGTEGLNGVARDNPLYLPPEEIVGDVGDVETA